MAVRRARSSGWVAVVSFAVCSSFLLFNRQCRFDSLRSFFELVNARVPTGVVRRRLLPVIATLVPTSLGTTDPAHAIRDDIPESRLALYRGKADRLRAGSEWWRFYIGDLITKGTGETAEDGLKSNSPDCGGGLCAAATALSQVRKLVRAPPGTLSQVDFALVTPMTTMADLSIWDPDIVDTAKAQVRDFELTIRKLGESISSKRDGDEAKKFYQSTLEQINVFLRTANEASGATPDDEQFLPILPLTEEDIQREEYWQERRAEYIRASDPWAQFQERNAIGSKELRKSLKRFPGATLLLR